MTTQELAQPQAQPATILVVEDDPDIQQLLRELLANSGYTVQVVESGGAAIQIATQDSIDLIVLDVMLPDISGFEVCDQVREQGPSNTPIIMLTALSQPQDVQRGLTGADDYITKPFDPQEFLLRIQKLIQRRQTVLALAQNNDALRNMLEFVQHQLQTAQTETHTHSLMHHELLHNVTVHLQSLGGIIDAELRKLPPSMERDAVQRIRMRVRGAALVYQVSEMLQHDPVSMGEIIRTTASALKSIYRPWKRIVLEVSGDYAEAPTTIAAPLAMVVNELVTNCFKHAFPENRFGTITITYTANDHTFQMTVVDDGVGMPATVLSGNGRATVTQIVGNLGGTIEWRRGANGTGTEVALQVPLPQ